MSHYKTKSDYNLDAAQVLLDKHYNPVSSIHCAYYGVFQFIRYKLERLGHSNTEIDTKITASKKLTPLNRLSTHGYPRDLMYNELKTKKRDANITAKEFKDKIKDLYLFRTETDYYDQAPDKGKAEKANKLTGEIITLINSI